MEIVRTGNKKIAEIHYLTDRKEIKNSLVSNIIRETLLKCYKELPIENKKVGVAYERNEWVKNNMDGVHGDALRENLISVYVNPTPGWKKGLVSTIAHEYSHLAVMDVRPWKNLLDSLIIEGIAEHFREEVVGGPRAFYTNVLTEMESLTILEKLKKLSKFRRTDMHHEVFFGSTEYKPFTGYTMGYYLVNNFREKHPDMKWKDIIKISPSEILKKSGFCNPKA